MLFFLEHPSRGVLTDTPAESGQVAGRWSWTKTRSEATMFSIFRAVEVRETLPPNVRDATAIRHGNTPYNEADVERELARARAAARHPHSTSRNLRN